MTRRKRMWILIPLILVVAYVGFGLAVYLFQDRLVYFPSKEVVATPGDVGLPYEDVSFAASDGVKLHGWLIPHGEAPVVLFNHGNAGNISGRIDVAMQYHSLGLGVLLYDYRGYGRSEGTPSEEGTYADARAAWEFLTVARGIDPRRIVVIGRSLGSAMAARIGAEKDPAALVLEAAFTSAPDLAAGMYKIYPARWLSRFSYDVKGDVRQVDCPILVVHARDDDLVPFRHGREVYAAAGGAKTFLELTGGHNGCFFESAAEYTSTLRAFLRQSGLKLPGRTIADRE